MWDGQGVCELGFIGVAGVVMAYGDIAEVVR